MSFFEELKRRNVVRVAAAYLALAWLVVQIVETLFPMFGISDAVARVVVIVLGIGFIPVLVLSWVFELTPEGLKRDAEVDHDSSAARQASRNLDRIFMVLLALGIAYFAVDKFLIDPARDAAQLEAATQAARQEGRAEATIDAFGDNSIAVLPFVNMSSDPEQEYFADGISEELLNLLAKIPELRVISRSSAFSFKGKEFDIPSVGRQLNVAHVLEGSVRKAGNTIRITAQLIEAQTDRHLWSETYDRTLGDVFAIQDEVAAHVVEELRLSLLGDVPKAKPVDPRAYSMYLKARAISNVFETDRFPEAVDLLNEALAIDPEYVDALVLLPIVNGLFSKDKETIDKILAIDPDNAIIKSRMAVLELDLGKAAQLATQALGSGSTNPEVIFNIARFAARVGRLDISVRASEFIVERDPLFFWAHLNLADYYLHAQRIDKALEQYRAAIAINPSDGEVQWKYGLALLVAGEPEAALAAFESEPERIPYGLHGSALAHHDLGQLEESAELLKELVQLEADVWPFGLARAYAWTGDADEAFRYLRQTTEPWFLGGLGTHPLFLKLHDDPRWLPFLESVGQAPEQLASIPFDIELPQ
jgi:adenylate cyclase